MEGGRGTGGVWEEVGNRESPHLDKFNGYQVGVTITVQNSFIQNEHSSFYLCMSWKSFVPLMYLKVPKCQ